MRPRTRARLGTCQADADVIREAHTPVSFWVFAQHKKSLQRHLTRQWQIAANFPPKTMFPTRFFNSFHDASNSYNQLMIALLSDFQNMTKSMNGDTFRKAQQATR